MSDLLQVLVYHVSCVEHLISFRRTDQSAVDALFATVRYDDNFCYHLRAPFL